MPPSVCLICSSPALTLVRDYRTESPAGKRLFGASTMSMCGGCGQPQVNPLPDEERLSSYYRSDYRKGGRYGADAADLSAFPRDNLFFFNRGASIAALLGETTELRGRPLRILDVGAGFGHILHCLGEAFPGSSATAHEMSEPCVAHLRHQGVTVWSGDLRQQITATDARFDLVVLSHVLEHLRDPIGTLTFLGERLNPRGVLYVEVPHVPAHSLNRYLDSPWAPRHDEPHLTFFGAPELRGVLERSGFAPTLIETAGPMYREVSAARYALPPLMPTLRRLVPPWIKRLAASQGAATLAERDPIFYAYGGLRIWLRSISQLA